MTQEEGCESRSLAQCLQMFYVFFLLFFAIESKLLLLLTNKVQKAFMLCGKSPIQRRENNKNIKQQRNLQHKNKIGAYHRCLWIYMGRPGRKKRRDGNLEAQLMEQMRRGKRVDFCRNGNLFSLQLKHTRLSRDV